MFQSDSNLNFHNIYLVVTGVLKGCLFITKLFPTVICAVTKWTTSFFHFYATAGDLAQGALFWGRYSKQGALFCFFFFGHVELPRPGIKPMPLEVEAQTLRQGAIFFQ